jgi:sugar phosphate isomerase/epimerase
MDVGASPYHPRLCVHPVSMMRPSLGEYLAALAATGARRTGVFYPVLEAEGWKESLDRIDAAGVDSAYLAYRMMFELDKPQTWDDARDALRRAIDLAGRYDRRIYGLTGPGPAVGLAWEDAFDAFVRAVAPVADYARTQDVRLMIEPTLPQFSDIHFIHSQREALELAESAGLDVCFEVNVAWNERGLEDTIARSGSRLGLVQLSDWEPGCRTTDRAVPGDGLIDLERIVRTLLDAGYDGPFDLELWGDQHLPDEEAVRRAAAYVSDLLERLSA